MPRSKQQRLRVLSSELHDAWTNQPGRLVAELESTIGGARHTIVRLVAAASISAINESVDWPPGFEPIPDPRIIIVPAEGLQQARIPGKPQDFLKALLKRRYIDAAGPSGPRHGKLQERRTATFGSRLRAQGSLRRKPQLLGEMTAAARYGDYVNDVPKHAQAKAALYREEPVVHIPIAQNPLGTEPSPDVFRALAAQAVQLGEITVGRLSVYPPQGRA